MSGHSDRRKTRTDDVGLLPWAHFPWHFIGILVTHQLTYSHCDSTNIHIIWQANAPADESSYIKLNGFSCLSPIGLWRTAVLRSACLPRLVCSLWTAVPNNCIQLRYYTAHWWAVGGHLDSLVLLCGSILKYRYFSATHLCSRMMKCVVYHEQGHSGK